MGVTLKERIRSDIESKIFSGEWPPGFRIPNEHQLMVSYDCSRMTVNKILSDLAAAGIIERRRRAGSFVTRPKIQSAILQIREIKAEIVSRGFAYGYELIELKRRTATKADAPDFNSKTRLLEFLCRHTADGRPFALEHRLLNLDAVPEADHQDYSHTPPGTWLLEHVPWTEAEHSISAIGADREIAQFLDVPVATACLVMRRQTWRSGDVITSVRFTYLGNLYELSAHFSSTQRRTDG